MLGYQRRVRRFSGMFGKKPAVLERFCERDKIESL